MELAIDNAIGTPHFFLRHSGIAHLAANIGCSLVIGTKTSKTFSFRLAVTIFLLAPPPSRFEFRIAFLKHAQRAVESPTLMTGFPLSPLSATNRRISILP